MNKYKLEIWYRYSGANQKDFLQIEVDAFNEHEACLLALSDVRVRSYRVFQVLLLEVNGQKLEKPRKL